MERLVLASLRLFELHRLEFIQHRIHIRGPGVFLKQTAELGLRLQVSGLE